MEHDKKELLIARIELLVKGLINPLTYDFCKLGIEAAIKALNTESQPEKKTQ